MKLPVPGLVYKKLWKPWPIEIDGLPINSMVIFQFAMLVIITRG